MKRQEERSNELFAFLVLLVVRCANKQGAHFSKEKSFSKIRLRKNYRSVHKQQGWVIAYTILRI